MTAEEDVCQVTELPDDVKTAAIQDNGEEVTNNALERILRGCRRFGWHGRFAGGNGHAGGAGHLGLGEVILVVGPVQAG